MVIVVPLYISGSGSSEVDHHQQQLRKEEEKEGMAWPGGKEWRVM